MPGRVDGFTVVELTVAMAFASVLLALAIPPYRAWQASNEVVASSSEVRSALRWAQTRSMTEGVTHRVLVSESDLSIRRGDVTSPAIRTVELPDAIVLQTAGFRAPNAAERVKEVVFLPRGVASTGSLTVTSQRTELEYRVTVSGLTGMVSIEALP